MTAGAGGLLRRGGATPAGWGRRRGAVPMKEGGAARLQGGGEGELETGAGGATGGAGLPGRGDVEEPQLRRWWGRARGWGGAVVGRWRRGREGSAGRGGSAGTMGKGRRRAPVADSGEVHRGRRRWGEAAIPAGMERGERGAGGGSDGEENGERRTVGIYRRPRMVSGREEEGDREGEDSFLH